MSKNQKLVIISIVSLAFLSQTLLLFATTVPMEELRQMYVEEIGETWDKATSDERKKFLYKIIGHKKKKARQDRVEGVTTPFYVREGFLRDNNKKWEDASEEEQEEYTKLWKNSGLKIHKKYCNRNQDC